MEKTNLQPQNNKFNLLKPGQNDRQPTNQNQADSPFSATDWKNSLFKGQKPLIFSPKRAKKNYQIKPNLKLRFFSNQANKVIKDHCPRKLAGDRIFPQILPISAQANRSNHISLITNHPINSFLKKALFLINQTGSKYSNINLNLCS